MSELDENRPDAPQGEEPTAKPPVVSYQMLAVLVFIMAIPSAIPLIVIIEPTAVPFLPGVDPDDSGTYLFLIGLSAVMLLANWTIVYVIWRWLNRYAADSEDAQ